MDPLKRLLLATSSWSQALHSPEDDNGGDFEDQEEGSDGVEDDEGQDDAGDGDEGEEQTDLVEDDDDGEDEGQENRSREVSAKTSRKEGRLAVIAREAKEAKAEAAAAKRELEALRQNQNRPPPETAEQRAQRLANMDPDQRTEYLLNEQGRKFQDQLNQIQFQSQDSADRTAFEGMCARNTVAARYKDEVESELQRLRQLGFNSPRETVLKYVIGEKALAGASKAKAKQERTAATNRTRQQARPSSSTSDVPAGNRRGGSEKEQRARRLENMSI
jgi:hypothetical protein